MNEDIVKVDINLTFEEIGDLSKDTFEELLKTKVRTKAFTDWLNLQKSHSKGKEIVFKQFSLQEYLLARNNLTNKDKYFVFKALSQTLEVKCNFKLGQSSLQCRLCDSRPALVTDEDLPATQQPPYNDIFCDNSRKVLEIVKLPQKKFSLFTAKVNRLKPCSASDNLNVNNDNEFI